MFGKAINRWRGRRADQALDDLDHAFAFDLLGKMVADGAGESAIGGLLRTAELQCAYGALDAAEATLRLLDDQLAGLAVDPEFTAYVYTIASGIRRARRDFPAALAAAEHAVARCPNTYTRMNLAWMKKHAGQLGAAIAILTELLPEDSDPYPVTLSLAGYLYLDGCTTQADRLLAEMPTSADPSVPMNLAWIAACRGDLDDCVARIREAMAAGDTALMRAYFGMDVEFDRFRDHAAFQAALDR